MCVPIFSLQNRIPQCGGNLPWRKMNKVLSDLDEKIECIQTETFHSIESLLFAIENEFYIESHCFGSTVSQR